MNYEILLFSQIKNFTVSKLSNPPYVPFARKKRNPWSIYCFCVSLQVFSGKQFHLGFLMTLKYRSISLSFRYSVREFDLNNNFLLVNHVILLAKVFIYQCKYCNVTPSLIVFKAKLKATYRLELFIAKRNGRLLNHYKKWNPLVSFFT